MNNAAQTYKLLFANQSVDTKTRYQLVRETKMYVFLEKIEKEPHYIFRVHKTTLSVKGIKAGKGGYRFNVANAIQLIKIN